MRRREKRPFLFFWAFVACTLLIVQGCPLVVESSRELLLSCTTTSSLPFYRRFPNWVAYRIITPTEGLRLETYSSLVYRENTLNATECQTVVHAVDKAFEALAGILLDTPHYDFVDRNVLKPNIMPGIDVKVTEVEVNGTLREEKDLPTASQKIKVMFHIALMKQNIPGVLADASPWSISLEKNSQAPHLENAIPYHHQGAFVRIYPSFFDEKPTTQWRTLLHEILHPLLYDKTHFDKQKPIGLGRGPFAFAKLKEPMDMSAFGKMMVEHFHSHISNLRANFLTVPTSPSDNQLRAGKHALLLDTSTTHLSHIAFLTSIMVAVDFSESTKISDDYVASGRWLQVSLVDLHLLSAILVKENRREPNRIRKTETRKAYSINMTGTQTKPGLEWGLGGGDEFFFFPGWNKNSRYYCNPGSKPEGCTFDHRAFGKCFSFFGRCTYSNQCPDTSAITPSEICPSSTRCFENIASTESAKLPDPFACLPYKCDRKNTLLKVAPNPNLKSSFVPCPRNGGPSPSVNGVKVDCPNWKHICARRLSFWDGFAVQPGTANGASFNMNCTHVRGEGGRWSITLAVDTFADWNGPLYKGKLVSCPADINSKLRAETIVLSPDGRHASVATSLVNVDMNGNTNPMYATCHVIKSDIDLAIGELSFDVESQYTGGQFVVVVVDVREPSKIAGVSTFSECRNACDPNASSGSRSRSVAATAIPGERCGDGNLFGNDGCGTNCRVEVGYTCSHDFASNLDRCERCPTGDANDGGSESPVVEPEQKRRDAAGNVHETRIATLESSAESVCPASIGTCPHLPRTSLWPLRCVSPCSEPPLCTEVVASTAVRVRSTTLGPSSCTLASPSSSTTSAQSDPADTSACRDGEYGDLRNVFLPASGDGSLACGDGITMDRFTGRAAEFNEACDPGDVLHEGGRRFALLRDSLGLKDSWNVTMAPPPAPGGNPCDPVTCRLTPAPAGGVSRPAVCEKAQFSRHMVSPAIALPWYLDDGNFTLTYCFSTGRDGIVEWQRGERCDAGGDTPLFAAVSTTGHAPLVQGSYSASLCDASSARPMPGVICVPQQPRMEHIPSEASALLPWYATQAAADKGLDLRVVSCERLCGNGIIDTWLDADGVVQREECETVTDPFRTDPYFPDYCDPGTCRVISDTPGVVCGDGSVTGGEECDPVFTFPTDGSGLFYEETLWELAGCDRATCRSLPLYTAHSDLRCFMATSLLGSREVQLCVSNGARPLRCPADAECYDGNRISGDGCSADCKVENSYVCADTSEKDCDENPAYLECAPVSKCQNSWHNGLGEACDDGNMEDGDGCDAHCNVEPGYRCSLHAVSSLPGYQSVHSVAGVVDCKQRSVFDSILPTSTFILAGTVVSCLVAGVISLGVAVPACVAILSAEVIASFQLYISEHRAYFGSDSGILDSLTIANVAASHEYCFTNKLYCDPHPDSPGIVGRQQFCNRYINCRTVQSCTATTADASDHCGNNIVEPLRGETCDDGNRVSGDGCSRACQIETGFECFPNAQIVKLFYAGATAPSEGCRNGLCGNGIRDPDEECDDGGTVALNNDGDWCDTDCTLRSGYFANGVASGWYSCGDGVREGDLTSAPTAGESDAGGTSAPGAIDFTFPKSEACDDGNTIGGDGCDEFCRVESGWSCSEQSPSRCTRCPDLELCSTFPAGTKPSDVGDPVLRQLFEQRCVVAASRIPCWDGNRNDTDGCTSTCSLSASPGPARWICPLRFPLCGGDSGIACCHLSCGNGAHEPQYGEECDPDVASHARRCDPDCTLHPRFKVLAIESQDIYLHAAHDPASYPSEWDVLQHGVVVPHCGEGHVDVHLGEACDDGNNLNGDGCDAQCAVEPGFTCAVPRSTGPSVCSIACGDGKFHNDKECDDGNTVSGDGCSSTCRVESGYACYGSPSVCRSPVPPPVVAHSWSVVSSEGEPRWGAVLATLPGSGDTLLVASDRGETTTPSGVTARVLAVPASGHGYGPIETVAAADQDEEQQSDESEARRLVQTEQRSPLESISFTDLYGALPLPLPPVTAVLYLGPATSGRENIAVAYANGYLVLFTPRLPPRGAPLHAGIKVTSMALVHSDVGQGAGDRATLLISGDTLMAVSVFGDRQPKTTSANGAWVSSASTRSGLAVLDVSDPSATELDATCAATGPQSVVATVAVGDPGGASAPGKVFVSRLCVPWLYADTAASPFSLERTPIAGPIPYPGDGFGGSLAVLADLDGDGVGELAVGTHEDFNQGDAFGSVWIVFLHTNRTAIKSMQRVGPRGESPVTGALLGDASGSLTERPVAQATLGPSFGFAVAPLFGGRGLAVGVPALGAVTVLVFDAVCGDGWTHRQFEECDDGGTVGYDVATGQGSRDGCSTTCTEDTGWACQPHPVDPDAPDLCYPSADEFLLGSVALQTPRNGSSPARGGSGVRTLLLHDASLGSAASSAVAVAVPTGVVSAEVATIHISIVRPSGERASLRHIPYAHAYPSPGVGVGRAGQRTYF